MRLHTRASVPARSGARIAGALLVLLALLLPVGLTPPAYAADQHQYWDNDEVTVQIHPDSTFDVTERQGFVFDSGTFHGSYRDIETNRLTGITNVSVSEEGVGAYRPDNTKIDIENGDYGPPQTFQVLNESGHKRIIWFYGTLQSPAKKTMVIKYTVTGGLRFYPGGDQFYWSPFMPDRNGIIEHATITVQVPPNIDLTTDPARKWAVYPADAGTVQVSPHQAVFTANGVLGTSDDFEARLQWSHGLIQGSPAPWQEGDDRLRAFQAQWGPVFTLLALLGGAIILIGGSLFWLVRWYTKGRDPVTGPIADYLNEPPSDLPAGLVGVLLDEKADIRDVIATILDLGRRGNLRIEEIKQKKGILGSESSDFQYTRLSMGGLQPYEQLVMNALFSGSKNTRKLSDLKNQFYSKLPAINKAMYQALVDRKLFPRSPDETRNRNRALAGSLFLLAFLSIFAAAFLGDLLTQALWIFPVAFAVPALFGFAMAGAMPQKTPKGAEQAARWQAFGRYLADLQRFGDLGQAAQRFGEFLPSRKEIRPAVRERARQHADADLLLSVGLEHRLRLQHARLQHRQRPARRRKQQQRRRARFLAARYQHDERRDRRLHQQPQHRHQQHDQQRQHRAGQFAQ